MNEDYLIKSTPYLILYAAIAQPAKLCGSADNRKTAEQLSIWFEGSRLRRPDDHDTTM